MALMHMCLRTLGARYLRNISQMEELRTCFYMNCTLKSLKGGYEGDSIGDYYRAY